MLSLYLGITLTAFLVAGFYTYLEIKVHKAYYKSIGGESELTVDLKELMQMMVFVLVPFVNLLLIYLLVRDSVGFQKALEEIEGNEDDE